MSDRLATNDIPADDPLLWEALPELTLNIAQTALLCGISVRQLGYWTRQGYVAAQGQGVRRTYGLASIRRVLAIRKMMEGGSSLRQSLRQIRAGTSLPISIPVKPMGMMSRPASPALAGSLTGSLIAFFEANNHTRDHAAGLAVKLGWDEADVQVAADTLCASGRLARNICQGMTIFYSAELGVFHA